jgi:hypothetical protein
VGQFKFSLAGHLSIILIGLHPVSVNYARVGVQLMVFPCHLTALFTFLLVFNDDLCHLVSGLVTVHAQCLAVCSHLMVIL